MQLLEYSFLRYAFWGSILAGIGCSLVGVLVVTLQIPFLGVAISHAAFAGAICGIVLGINPLWMAYLFCAIVTFIIGPLADKANFRPEISVGILFSLMLGLAFLFLANIPGAKTEALSLMWGSILTINRTQLLIMAITSLLVLLFLVFLFKQIKVVLFNRQVANSLGIPERFIYYTIIILCSLVITANMSSIGGLLIFSLLINPAASALQLCYTFSRVCIVAVVIGVGSCLLGLLLSYHWNLPTGAMIILVSSIIFMLSLIFSPKKGFLKKIFLLKESI
ncbi:MAG: metal ABC transporter permease [Candidatus Omnitrophica bacterium]|nr:metal ABC transporter permease [Candidatus Omnitrophota bacterium]